jgi:hypothetical protein
VTEPAPEQRDYCPNCQAAYEPLQEYCLECGERLPTNRGVVGYLASQWQRRLAWYPGDWIWPVLLFLLLTVVATVAAVAAGSPKKREKVILATSTPVSVGPGATQGAVPTVIPTSTLPIPRQPTISTGPLPSAPGAPSTGGRTTPAPSRNPNALTFWPAGKSGYTIVLESIPVGNGRELAVARARQAKRRGVQQAGILVSSQYSSLHPGYYVVFAGVFGSPAQANAALSTVHARGYPDAYQTRVTK